MGNSINNCMSCLDTKEIKSSEILNTKDLMKYKEKEINFGDSLKSGDKYQFKEDSKSIIANSKSLDCIQINNTNEDYSNLRIISNYHIKDSGHSLESNRNRSNDKLKIVKLSNEVNHLEGNYLLSLDCHTNTIESNEILEDTQLNDKRILYHIKNLSDINSIDHFGELYSLYMEIQNISGIDRFKDEEQLQSTDQNTNELICFVENNQSLYFGRVDKNLNKKGLGLFICDEFYHIGNFNNNVKEDFGRSILKNHDIYEGYYQSDLPNGIGKFYSSSKFFYRGNFKNGLQDGYGEEYHSNGTQYKGFFTDDIKSGIGELYFNGTYFIGNFQSNTLEGISKIIYEDGSTYEGYTTEFKLDGLGSFTWEDKRKYVGYYKSEKRNGFGIMFNPEGYKYEGMWNEGNKHGLGLEYTQSKISLKEWRMNKQLLVLLDLNDETNQSSAFTKIAEDIQMKAINLFNEYNDILIKIEEIERILSIQKKIFM